MKLFKYRNVLGTENYFNLEKVSEVWVIMVEGFMSSGKALPIGTLAIGLDTNETVYLSLQSDRDKFFEVAWNPVMWGESTITLKEENTSPTNLWNGGSHS